MNFLKNFFQRLSFNEDGNDLNQSFAIVETASEISYIMPVTKKNAVVVMNSTYIGVRL